MAAALDTYLKLAGVTGESTRKGYESWIEIESFDFDVSKSSASAPKLPMPARAE
ncbi:MAG TPA: type VI secretion system tube protein Hcp [Gemmatimonadaceae bacterium]|nr:type VI secretion system tube protein Hcp [Gemmatimonadaceae bacterium]